MATKFVKFPPEKQADALAYEAECTVQLGIYTGGMETRWALIRQDRNNNWTVPLYGPPWVWDQEEVAEPESCAALRVDAVVVDHPEWPEVEE
jgi:hypothetical protein